MKLSLHWLNEYIDLAGKTAEEIGEKLTLHTCELEEVLDQADFYKNVVVGELVDIKPHPEAEKLSIAQMDCGKHGKKQIIFGQVHAVSLGEKLPVALAGARLKSGISIEASEIRGQKSEGMITDNSELGMKNPGLLRFDLSTPNGAALEEVCTEFKDVLLDIDNKSLTHRPDLMGHAGFMRELKAIYGVSGGWEVPVMSLKNPGQGIKAEIQTQMCRRFTAIRIEGVRVEPSSMETMVRLENIGVRSISQIVDITNWIMLGYGQPMHVFDADKIDGKLIIRAAKRGEKLLALDGEEYELNEMDTVVADEKKVLSIAGIMGGMESGVTAATQNVVFECANWDPVAIRKTSTRLGLRSDSSMRYEKSLDPESCIPALAMAVQMTQQLCPSAKLIGDCVDIYPYPWQVKTLELSTQEVRDRIGIDIPDEDLKKFLESLDFKVVLEDGMLQVEIPSYRDTKDIQIGADLIEEIVRLYGFDQVPSTLPPLSANPPKENKLRSLEWWLRDFWSQQGYLEVQHYGYVADTDVFTDTKKAVQISNPLSSETSFMRQTLLSGMMKELESEVRMHRNVGVFELGKTYIPQGEVLPKEELFLGVLRSSTEFSAEELLFNLKGSFEQSFAHFGIPVFFQQGQVAPWAHPGRSASMLVDGEILGEIFEVHPSYNACEAATIYAQINVQRFEKLWSQKDFVYRAPSNFPPVRRDIAFVVDEKTSAGAIEQVLLDIKGIEHVDLFDEFSDEKKIGKGKKNLAYHITLRSYDSTLDEAAIDVVMKQVAHHLKDRFQAELRS